jgi:hypothetical protein
VSELNTTLNESLLLLAEVVEAQNRSHNELILQATQSGEERVAIISRIAHQNITEMQEHIQTLLVVNLSSINATVEAYSFTAAERHSNLTDKVSGLQLDLQSSNSTLLELLNNVNTSVATNHDLLNVRLDELVVVDEDIKKTLLSSRLELLEETRSLNESFSGIVLKLDESLRHEIAHDVNESYIRVVSSMNEQREELDSAVLLLNTSQWNSFNDLRHIDMQLNSSIVDLNKSLAETVSELRLEVDRNSSLMSSVFASAVAEVNNSLVTYNKEVLDKFAEVNLSITSSRNEQAADMSGLRLIVTALNQTLSSAFDAEFRQIQFDLREEGDHFRGFLAASINHLNSTLTDDRISAVEELSKIQEQLKQILDTANERGVVLSSLSARIDAVEPTLTSVETTATSITNRLAILEDKASIASLSSEKIDSELSALKASVLSPLRSNLESMNHTILAQVSMLSDRLSTADTIMSSVTSEASKIERRIEAVETKLAVVVEKTLPSLSERIAAIEMATSEQSRRILALETFSDDAKRRTAGRDEVDSLRTMLFELQTSVVAHSAKVLEMVGNMKH